MRRALLAAAGIAMLAGCGQVATSVDGSSAAPTPTVTVTVVVTPSPTQSTNTSPAPTSVTSGAVETLSAGLFCRDLAALGYSYAQSVAYWSLQGRPDRMDADRNGIPCETVYPAQDVRDYYGDSVDEPTPQGTLRILGPLHGDYGQGFSRWRECSNWTLRFVNDSDTTISKVIFDPPSAAYTGPWDPAKQEYSQVPAEPSAEVLVVSLQPGVGRDVTFQTCTSTPPPADPDYGFSVRAPASIQFHWSTGATGTTEII